MTDVAAEAGPTALASSLRVFADALHELGADCDAILRECEIDPASMQDPDARIPQANFDRVWVTAAQRTGDPCIGLHAGALVRPRAVNIFGYLALTSANIGEGLERVARYQRLVAGRTWLNLRDEQGVEHIELATEEPIGDQRAIRAEYSVLLVLAFIRWVADREVSPLEVSFEHAPRGPVEDYARVLRCPVKFEAPHSEILFAKGTLDLPSVHANPTMAQAADAFAARLLADLPGGGAVAYTRRALAALLDSGEGDVRKVSRRLGMSARTLQRRLAEEGQSFRGVLDQLRRELAQEHLRQRRSSIAEAAHLTGFSEVSAFARAVRRWFGCTPRELRDTARLERDGSER